MKKVATKSVGEVPQVKHYQLEYVSQWGAWSMFYMVGFRMRQAKVKIKELKSSHKIELWVKQSPHTPLECFEYEKLKHNIFWDVIKNLEMSREVVNGGDDTITCVLSIINQQDVVLMREMIQDAIAIMEDYTSTYEWNTTCDKMRVWLSKYTEEVSE